MSFDMQPERDKTYIQRMITPNVPMKRPVPLLTGFGGDNASTVERDMRKERTPSMVESTALSRRDIFLLDCL